MSSTVLELAISAMKRLQTYALNRTVTGMGGIVHRTFTMNVRG